MILCAKAATLVHVVGISDSSVVTVACQENAVPVACTVGVIAVNTANQDQKVIKYAYTHSTLIEIVAKRFTGTVL